MKKERKLLLGCRLRAARLGVQQSQADVADALRVTRQSVSSWERGVSSPSAIELGELAAMYCVCAHELLFGERFQPVSMALLLPPSVGDISAN